MRNVLYLIVGVCLLYSCSGTPKEKEVTVSDVEITGFLKDYIKVVDGSYKFTVTGREASITVKLELVNKPTNYCEVYSSGGIRLNPIGDGNEIYDTGIYGFDAQDNEVQKVSDLLNGNVGDTKNVLFKWEYFSHDEELGNAILTKSVSFELIDKAFEECSVNDSSSESSSENVSENVSDWDEVLNEYEEYVDSYVKLLKQAKNGDVSAITESANLMKSAESLGSKLENAKDNMSAAQVKKYMKLQEKMLSAAIQ